MARKFGKKNVIKIDPLAYNIGLIGESGIGKTTIAKEVCEKLVGENGYIVLNIGKEDGIDAIPNAIYEDVPDWETFDEITLDIIDNKNTDYKDLKVLVYDTLDELVDIAENRVIKMHNLANPDKKASSINGAFGGFGAGMDKVIELILDRIWELKQVGVSMFIIGHTKLRTLTDPITNLEYDMLTTNISHRYFNAVKTKLHILGVASIDRSIKTETQKNKIGKTETIGQIVDESRIITFRDDNFNIDSKSRFEDIVPSIPLNSDMFIKALKDAIKSAHNKQDNPKDIEKAKKEQEIKKEKEIEQVLKERNAIDIDKNKELIGKITQRIKSATDEAKEKMKGIMQEYKITSFKDIESIETKALEKIVQVL